MKYIKKRSLITVLWLFVLVPAIAQSENDCTNTSEICNPLKSDDITGLLENVINVVTTLAVPIIAIMIIYAGFLFVTAGGETDQIDKAKSTALYVAIGAAIILGADLIIAVLQNTTDSIGGGGLD